MITMKTRNLNNPSAHEGELLDIEQQEAEQSMMEAKKSYLKKALPGKSRFIIKKRLIYADMAWGTEFQIQLLRDPTRSPQKKPYSGATS